MSSFFIYACCSRYIFCWFLVYRIESFEFNQLILLATTILALNSEETNTKRLNGRYHRQYRKEIWNDDFFFHRRRSDTMTPCTLHGLCTISKKWFVAYQFFCCCFDGFFFVRSELILLGLLFLFWSFAGFYYL